jgi:hypothetical protein
MKNLPNFKASKKSLTCLLLFILFAEFITIANAQTSYLVEILIYPNNPTMGIGQSLVFNAVGKDQYGNYIAIPNPTWEGDGTNGTITPTPNIPSQCTYYSTKQGNGYIICWSGPSGSDIHGSTDITIVKALDFGDAPDPTYNTLMQSNGAFHIVDFNIYLGSRIDAESDGQPDSLALGDDNSGEDDEDGVVFNTNSYLGATTVITVTASVDGFLNGFVDFAANGHWGDVGDRIFLNRPLVTGQNILKFFIPSNAATGQTFARFRFTTDSPEGGHCFASLAENGEVEDYEIIIKEIPENGLDFGDAPDSPYHTLLANYGAYHVIDPAIYLGEKIDAELDGQPQAQALGDDNDGNDDEDGIIFVDPLIPGIETRIEVKISEEGFLNAWVDFDINGDWDSANDRIYMAQFVSAGKNYLSFRVPETAEHGKTFARFRYQTAIDTVCYSGLVHNGEVEDYEVTILDASNGLDFGDAPDPFYPTLLANNGAWHIIDPEIFLGALIDAEPDGLPEPHAGGDDINGSSDEDGIMFDAPLFAGLPAGIKVTASTNGYLNFWLDLNGDGDWTDNDEQIFTDKELNSGTNELTFTIPLSATADTTFARFRFSTVKGLNNTGWAINGEVEDYLVMIEKLPGEMEFGDAPDPTYPTLLANDGARHIPWGRSVLLGSKKDVEPDGQPDPHALGDDNDGKNDDDGVVFVDLLIPDTTTKIEVTASANGFLYAWIDFDANGDWDSTNDQIFNAQPLTTGKNILSFFVPAAATYGNTFARFRFTNIASMMDYRGIAFGGEVEDYEVTIIDASNGYDFGDAPDPSFPTLLVSNGARHIINPTVMLGTFIDADSNGLQEANALGDDNNGFADEDGVIITSPIIAGQTTFLSVKASIAGYLNAWIDFDGDGDWGSADEQIFSDLVLDAGMNALSFLVPASVVIDSSFARFRFSTSAGLNYIGLALDGEVEDYKVIVEEEIIREVKWSQPALKNPDSIYPLSYWGWGEHSTYIREEKLDTTYFVADDWFCYDLRPVTSIRWWGSYADWDSIVAPEDGPWGFQIGLWTDIPKSEINLYSHPGKMIRDWKVSRLSVNERLVGSDYLPERMAKRDSCFQYHYSLPHSEWFQQEGDSAVYWLSISAIYDTIPDFHVWGWKTRDRYYNDEAVRIFKPYHPGIDSLFRIGEIVELGWDMSFELLTNELGEGYDFGDAPDPGYHTLHLSNGAEHFPLPGEYLGSTIDLEFDGLPNGSASGDDADVSDDEDGVSFNSQIVPGDTTFLTVRASVNGYLNTWIDFDRNGTWDDAGDQVFFDLPLKTGSNNLKFFVPDDVAVTTTYARFRFATENGFTYKGLVIGGEVEDYVLTIYTGVENKSSQLPSKFKLYQNFPNPFNPTTEIRYLLPKAEHVRLSIYNISGQEIRVLVDGIKSNGDHKVIWDGKDGRGNNMPAGLYLYSIKTKTLMDSKKLLLIK